MGKRRWRNERVLINVKGKQYETFERTLARFPNTLLGNYERRQKYYNPDTGEYVFDFDTSESAFGAILFYYQSSGIMSRPSDVKEEDFEEAMRLFEIFQMHLLRQDIDLPQHRRARKLWMMLEYPETSLAGKIMANFSFMMILASSVTFCIETVDRKPKEIGNRRDNVWFTLESIFIAWFTLEYIARVISAPRKSDFLFSLLGLIDLAAIVPYFATLIVMEDASNARSFAIIRAFRLVQAFRIIKLTRHSKSLQLMGKALLYCRDQVGSLMFFLSINALAGASIMFQLEYKYNKDFDSMISGIWFCIISMTTVGYGDIVPVTIAGKIAGVFCIIMGSITLFHLFLPVYLTYFSLFYNSSKHMSSKGIGFL
ncbi:potassium voltage-gated channel subfamily A member 2-like [Rhopilema esculentum]|uniref:potassium voltage-gated channel subfamily A member 2-like n=1 Tax=Rhopilema esculentum TaxID=499914 RepID=UPI0031E08703|eukprot:gene6247-11659_t